MPKKYSKRKQNPNLQQTQLYDQVTKLESQILADLQYLNKKKNYKFDCLHCYEQMPQIEDYDPNINYYDEFWKSFLINTICIKRFYDYKTWIEKISKKINNIEVFYLFYWQIDQQITYNKRKRLMQPIESKRSRKNIQSSLNNEWDFSCDICGKNYKDEGSLEIHKSIKHETEQIKFQPKIEQLNHHFYMQQDNSNQNYYSDD